MLEIEEPGCRLDDKIKWPILSGLSIQLFKNIRLGM